MKNQKLNEQESLELITNMIQNTRHNLDMGSGNMFLLWGYVSAIVTLVIIGGLYWSKSVLWMWGFWGIPVIGYLFTILVLPQRQKYIKTYTDKVLGEIWGVLGVFCMVVSIAATFTHSYEIILPLCAIILPIGSIITGIIIRYTSFSLFSIVGLLLGLDMMMRILVKTFSYSYWDMAEFVLIVIFVMIIPGHFLNYKAKKESSKLGE